LPEVVHGLGTEFFDLTQSPNLGDSVIFIYINFSFRSRDVQGYIAMLLDLPSLAMLKSLLGALIERTQ
jgi:chemotaxis protein CheC